MLTAEGPLVSDIRLSRADCNERCARKNASSSFEQLASMSRSVADFFCNRSITSRSRVLCRLNLVFREMHTHDRGAIAYVCSLIFSNLPWASLVIRSMACLCLARIAFVRDSLALSAY